MQLLVLIIIRGEIGNCKNSYLIDINIPIKIAAEQKNCLVKINV